MLCVWSTSLCAYNMNFYKGLAYKRSTPVYNKIHGIGNQLDIKYIHLSIASRPLAIFTQRRLSDDTYVSTCRFCIIIELRHSLLLFISRFL